MNRQTNRIESPETRSYTRKNTYYDRSVNKINEKELRIINGSWEIDDLNVKNNKLLPYFIYKIQVQVD